MGAGPRRPGDPGGRAERLSGVLVICRGGPIAEPEDARYVIERVSGLDGFFGASHIGRFAAERGVRERAAAFKSTRRPRPGIEG